MQTLNALLEMIATEGQEGFCAIWNYKHIERVDLLWRLCSKFIEYKSGVMDDLDAMKRWAKETRAEDYKKFGVAGIGLATFQYLRMLLGVPTVKPDVHILRAVEEALGEKQTLLTSIVLLEDASMRLGLDPTFVDHNIWKYFSSTKATPKKSAL